MKTSNPWIASGLIVLDGKMLAVSVDTSLLVFDVNSWVRSIKHRLEADLDQLLRSGNLEGASEVRAMVQDLQAGAYFPPITLRQMVKPSVVDRSSIRGYVGAICSVSKIAPISVSPEFLLVVESGRIELFVRSRLVAQAIHTGDDIRGTIVTSSELECLIAREMDRITGSKFAACHVPLSCAACLS